MKNYILSNTIGILFFCFITIVLSYKIATSSWASVSPEATSSFDKKTNGQVFSQNRYDMELTPVITKVEPLKFREPTIEENPVYFVLNDIYSKLDAILTNQEELTYHNASEPPDPNDPIYALMWPQTPEWSKTYGNSERSRLISNISSLNRVVIELVKMVNAQGERIKVLEGWQKAMNTSDPNTWDTWALDPNIVDPNGAEE